VGWLILQFLHLPAQSPQPQTPFAGKTIAVFFSLKHFSFSDHYLLPLSQFIKTEEGKEATVEDIRQQTLIILAEQFCQQAAAVLGADSVYFLSAQPELAQAFMQQYEPSEATLSPLGQAFAGTDFIWVIDPLTLGGYQTSSVYTRSNRIITEKVVVKTARVESYWFNPATGALTQQYISCFDERKNRVAAPYFQFNNQESPVGFFFASLFSRVADQVTGKGEGNCEE
jgi:hypothetical protein